QKDTEGKVAGVPSEFMRPPREMEQPPREVERPPREVERPPREVERPPREVERPPREERPPPEEELPLVVDLELLLTTPDKEKLVGRQVELEDAPVQSVVGDFTFWVGPDAERRVPVVLLGELMGRQPETRVEVRAQQRVRVFGVVRGLRDVESFDADRLLSPREREALQQSDIFISASRVVTLEP
ncbi:MAG TPA: hypothetical protein VLQ93_10660, partial [Myxococcaceae bacterium]|nr:hypothetical protein [Myxococcaceae bacterium]